MDGRVAEEAELVKRLLFPCSETERLFKTQPATFQEAGFFMSDFATEGDPVVSSTKTYAIRRKKMDWHEKEKDWRTSSL